MSEANTTEATPAAEEPAKGKSIVDAKYRGKYKNRHEWLADLLKAKASLSHEIPAKPAVGEEGKDGYKAATPARTVVDGVDTNALFKIARENGLDVDKYESQKDSHGFPGRFRMTVGNMLRTVARQRHGLTINGEWQDAPADWLKEQGVEGEPTHTHDGTKIAKAAPPKAETESKLIKADAEAKTAEAKTAEAPKAETKAAAPAKKKGK